MSRFYLAMWLFSLNASIPSNFDESLHLSKVYASQEDLEKTLRLIQNQFKKNGTNKNRVDLKGSKLIMYNNDGSWYEFDLNVIEEIRSEYNSGKYILYLGVHSNSTLGKRDIINVIYCYDYQGFITDRAVGVSMPFNSYQNAVLTRDSIRKLKRIINS